MKPTMLLRLCVLFAMIGMIAGCGQGGVVPGSTTNPPTTYPFTAGAGPNWVTQFGSSAYPPFTGTSIPAQQILSSVAATNTNIIVGGYTIGSIFGGSNPNNAAKNFLASFSAGGSLAWSNEFGTDQGDFLSSVSVGPSQQIFVAGDTLGALPGASNPTRETEAVLYRFESTGALTWQRQYTIDGTYTSPVGAVGTPDGNVVVAGTFSEANSPTTTDIYLAKFDGTTGAPIWTVRLGSQVKDYVNAIAADSQGTLYVTGSTSGPFPGAGSGADMPFVASFDGRNGNRLWTQIVSDSGRAVTAPLAMTVGAGGVYVAGTSSTTAVSVNDLPSPVARAFLNNYQTVNGSLLWSKAYDSGTGDQITGVAIAQSGDIVAVGSTNGVLASGFTARTHNHFILEVGADGTSKNAFQLGTGVVVNHLTRYGPRITTLGTSVVMAGPVQAPFSGYTNPDLAVQSFLAAFTR